MHKTITRDQNKFTQNIGLDQIVFSLTLGLVYDLNVNMPFLDVGVFHMKVIHIISHTDLDGVTAAAVAWHRYFNNGYLIKVSLTGYGDVDNLVLECLKKEENFVVLDLFCQRTQTVDMLDKEFEFPSEPVFLIITRPPRKGSPTDHGQRSIPPCVPPRFISSGCQKGIF